jgi:hypothetical protein
MLLINKLSKEWEQHNKIPTIKAKVLDLKDMHAEWQWLFA